MNYFELFDLPISLTIDEATLNKKYVALQKKYHPDFFTQQTDEEQQEALEKSSAINKGLKILRNKDATIFYVLQLHNMIEEEEKYPLPQNFLMEVMELNENLTENSAVDIAAFEKNIYAAISDTINNYNNSTVTKEQLLLLKEYYYKKKYLHRILDRISG